MGWLKRIAYLPPLLILITFLAFLLMRMAPGGPFDKERATSPDIERQLAQKYHLDKPLWQQYWIYLKGVFQGDFGPSLKYRNHSVNDIIKQGLPVSMTLGFLSFLFAVGIGLPLGMFAAIHRGKAYDWMASFLALLAVCVPGFVVGPLLVMVFAVHWEIFPVALWESPWHMILPTFALGLYFSGKIARLTREGFVEALQSPFIMTARSKGLSERAILFKHGWRMGVLPVMTYAGPLLADLLTGSFVVENIFQIPGIGVFLVNSSTNRDYPMIMGLVILYATLLLVLNFIVDQLYAWLDPRVR